MTSRRMQTADDFDVILVGGGFANSLIAMRLQALRPDIRWLILERQNELFGHPGEQTWSFHASDLDGSTSWLKSLASSSWPGYWVNFSDLSRRFDGTYFSIRARDLRAKMAPVVFGRAMFGIQAIGITASNVTLRGGREFRARLVIDGRGFFGRPPYPCGYQKFVGLNLRLDSPHGLVVPTLMDAAVDQSDGYRFFYVLPWSPSELLIEETYYSNSPDLEERQAENEILGYAASRGWKVLSIESRERGILPIPLASRSVPACTHGVLGAGVGSGRFHPTTGYSAPDAARLAERVATSPVLDADLANNLHKQAREIWERRGFLRRLNNMLFLATPPKQRWRVLRQFYERDATLIARFYAAKLTPIDRARLLSGTPPIPIQAAMRAFVRSVANSEGTQLDPL